MDNQPNQPESVYRLATDAEWRETEATGLAPLRPIDKADGYLHLSTRDQLLETAGRHFAECASLLALEIPLNALGDAVKFELAPKRGALFPHLYGDLARDCISKVLRLQKTRDGFQFEEAV